MPVIEGAGVLTTAATLAVGGWLVHEGQVTLGTVTFFVLTLSNLFEPLNQLSQLFNIVQSAGAGLQQALRHARHRARRSPIRASPVAAAGRRRRRARPARRSATATGRYVLRDVSLRIEPGERLAVVGPTGAGKSTVAKLVARLYDPTDGVGAHRRRRPPRRRRSPTCAGTCASCPRRGSCSPGRSATTCASGGATPPTPRSTPPSTPCGVLDRFAALPEGLDTPVRERGSRLSAGEKQLVSLARAALADPEVLVLDEATSSLDPGTERLVEHALEALDGRAAP